MKGALNIILLPALEVKPPNSFQRMAYAEFGTAPSPTPCSVSFCVVTTITGLDLGRNGLGSSFEESGGSPSHSLRWRKHYIKVPSTEPYASRLACGLMLRKLS